MITSTAPGILDRLEQIDNLPTLPVVVGQIQKLIGSENSSMAQVAAIIARDQSIATRVIRLVNSAFYALRSPVTSIQQAIVLLGLNTVRNIVTGVSIVRAFESNQQPSLFDRERFWLHTFACAMGARAVAVRRKCLEPEDFFLAGLLHDMGILVLDQFFHPEFVEVLRTGAQGQAPLFESEHGVLGITHCEIGDYLGRRWGIPEVLTLTIRHHHDSTFENIEAGPHLDAVVTVHVCDAAANDLGIHMGIRSGPRQCNPAALKHLGISEREVQVEFDAVQRNVDELMREWGI